MPPFVYNGSMFTTVYNGKPYCGCNAPANVRRHGLRWPKNGDGIPNDTWYELKGSETCKPGVTQRYALKYYKPTAEKTDVLSIDNDGNLSFLKRNAYHPESGYFPWFMEGDYYSMPRYPINPNTFRMGISWNFYN